jgi:hypothetical protein
MARQLRLRVTVLVLKCTTTTTTTTTTLPCDKEILDSGTQRGSTQQQTAATDGTIGRVTVELYEPNSQDTDHALAELMTLDNAPKASLPRPLSRSTETLLHLQPTASRTRRCEDTETVHVFSAQVSWYKMPSNYMFSLHVSMTGKPSACQHSPTVKNCPLFCQKRYRGGKLTTRWFKYDRDKLWLLYTQIVPVIFEPPCIWECQTEKSDAIEEPIYDRRV